MTNQRLLVLSLQTTGAVDDKLARHGVLVSEVRELFTNPRRVRTNRRRANRIEVLGRTNGGRALVVALDPTCDETVWEIVTAYDAPANLIVMIP